MSTYKAAMTGVPFRMQEEETEGNGLPICPNSTQLHHTFYIMGSAGVSAGAVQIESAVDPSAPDEEWGPATSAVTVTAEETSVVTLEGIFKALRARISTTVADGTVTVDYVAGKP